MQTRYCPRCDEILLPHEDELCRRIDDLKEQLENCVHLLNRLKLRLESQTGLLISDEIINEANRVLSETGTNG